MGAVAMHGVGLFSRQATLRRCLTQKAEGGKRDVSHPHPLLDPDGATSVPGGNSPMRGKKALPKRRPGLEQMGIITQTCKIIMTSGAKAV